MRPVDVARLDLNLLRTLSTLLEERSVTRAAQRLGVTQSTVSHALARLRALLDDPLLVRSGASMLRTPRAEAMAPELHRALGELVRSLDAEVFRPSDSTRVFSLLCPDLLAALLPSILARLGGEAPGVGLRVRPPIGVDVPAALASGAWDLAVGPTRDVAPGLMRKHAGRVGWCVVARRGHPAAPRGKLTLERWLDCTHVLVATDDDGPGHVGRALGETGTQRRIGLVAPGFLVALLAVRHSDMLFTAPRELAEPLAATLDLQILPHPARLARVPIALLWHERYHGDPGRRWLVRLLGEALAELLPAD